MHEQFLFDMEVEVNTVSGRRRRTSFLPGNRALIAEMVFNNRDVLIRQSKNALLSAREVLDVLKAQNLIPGVLGQALISANGMGDVLGSRHFNLPFLVVGNLRKYLIPAMEWTADEHREFEALAPLAKLTRIERLQETLLNGTTK